MSSRERELLSIEGLPSHEVVFGPGFILGVLDMLQELVSIDRLPGTVLDRSLDLLARNMLGKYQPRKDASVDGSRGYRGFVIRDVLTYFSRFLLTALHELCPGLLLVLEKIVGGFLGRCGFLGLMSFSEPFCQGSRSAFAGLVVLSDAPLHALNTIVNEFVGAYECHLPSLYSNCSLLSL